MNLMLTSEIGIVTFFNALFINILEKIKRPMEALL